MPDQPTPTLPPDLQAASDHERLAQDRIPTDVLAYIEGGSGQELTLRRNREAFSRHAILPRLLRPLEHGHTRLRLLGQALPHPILLAPVAWQKLVHPQGEIDTARGASAMDTCMVLSTLSSCSLEDVAQHAERRWFQLYWQASREHTLALVRRAEAAGYSALVLTLDASVQTPSLRAQRAGFRFPADVQAVNLQDLPPIPLPAIGPDDSAIFQGVMSPRQGGTTCGGLVKQRPCPCSSKACCAKTTPCTCEISGSMHRSFRTTAAARSTAHPPASIACPRCAGPWARTTRCCSTAASAAAAMCSRRSPWAPTPC